MNFAGVILECKLQTKTNKIVTKFFVEKESNFGRCFHRK